MVLFYENPLMRKIRKYREVICGITQPFAAPRLYTAAIWRTGDVKSGDIFNNTKRRKTNPPLIE